MATARRAQADDQELMQRVQQNDADAFGVLYDRFAPRAHRVAAILCADAERARDAVQEGFLSVWRSRATYLPERGEVHAWVISIVRNRAIDTIRHHGHHDRHRAGDEDLASNLAGEGDVATSAVDNDQARHLRGLLAGLPAAQREVMALAYFGGLTHAEIAEQLGLPLGTVKGRMRLGLTRLRDELAA